MAKGSTKSEALGEVFFAMPGNANEWDEIESLAKRKEKWLRKYEDVTGYFDGERPGGLRHEESHWYKTLENNLHWQLDFTFRPPCGYII